MLRKQRGPDLFRPCPRPAAPSNEMARQARLFSESYGDEPERRVRILRAN